MVTSFDIKRFTSVFEKYGAAPSDMGARFMMIVPTPPILQSYSDGGNVFNAADLTFFCTTSEIPSVSLATQSVVRHGIGPGYPYPTGVRFGSGGDGGTSIDLNFYYDSKGMIRKFFETWMQHIVYHGNVTDNLTMGLKVGDLEALPYEHLYKSEYCVRGNLIQYDAQGQTIRNYFFEKMWPSAIKSAELKWQTEGSTKVPTVDVTFHYDQWWSSEQVYPSNLYLTDRSGYYEPQFFSNSSQSETSQNLLYSGPQGEDLQRISNNLESKTSSPIKVPDLNQVNSTPPGVESDPTKLNIDSPFLTGNNG